MPTKEAKPKEENRKLVNFRLPLAEFETLKILAKIADMSQADVLASLIRMEGLKQKDAIKTYLALKEKVKL